MDCYQNGPTACVIMASDPRGMEATATTLNSLKQNCSLPIHARVFVRDLPEASFESDRLKVEILNVPLDQRRWGNVPAHVDAGACYDRIAGAMLSTDWDHALILDFDQIAIGEIDSLFQFPLGEALAAGRLWTKTLGDAARDWFGRNLPATWRHAEGYRFFYMGPLLNLKRLRESNAFEIFDRFNSECRMEEQIALTVALEDRILELPHVYNIVPQWEGIPFDSRILHFTGPNKPWMDRSMAGAEHWERYSTTWARLSGGKFEVDSPKRIHVGGAGPSLSGWHSINPRGVNRDRKALPNELGNWLPFPSESTKLIYVEHALEHLDFSAQQKFFRECRRILEPAGVLRVVTPHLDKLASEIFNPTMVGTEYCKWAAAEFPWGVAGSEVGHVLNNLMRAWGHQFIHTRKTLVDCLQGAGFHDGRMEFLGLNESTHEELRNLANVDRMPEGLLDFESLVVEATK